jgi:hypothetical protein
MQKIPYKERLRYFKYQFDDLERCEKAEQKKLKKDFTVKANIEEQLKNSNLPEDLERARRELREE